MSREDAMEHPTVPAVPPVKALGIVAAVVVAVAAYLGLVALLGIREGWAGFLFLAVWGLMDKLDLKAAPARIVGALAGLALAWTMGGLAPWIGAAASLAVFLALVLAAVYLQVRGQAAVVVNAATMIFLSVGTIPQVQAGADFAHAALAVLLAAAFFCGLALAGAQLARRRSAAAPA
jgi:hypothetical protein